MEKYRAFKDLPKKEQKAKNALKRGLPVPPPQIHEDKRRKQKHPDPELDVRNWEDQDE